MIKKKPKNLCELFNLIEFCKQGIELMLSFGEDSVNEFSKWISLVQYHMP